MGKITGFVKNGNLIPEQEWKNMISEMENDFDNLETNLERAKRDVAKVLVEAVKKRINPKFGILFSGGVDSSIIAFICKQLKCNFTCYTVGIENSDDILWAERVAKEYSFKWKFKTLSLEEFEADLKSTVNILNDADIVKASVGSVLYCAARLAISNNDNILFGGLGSEEIFAGYRRHTDVFKNNDFEALHKECWMGLKNMWNRDLTRDFAIAKNLGLSLRAPFLDFDLVKTAMAIHPMHKIDGENKKIVLREAAEFIGLKKDFAWRKKQAAQYGSNFVNGIDKLARKSGFKFKKDYLQSLLK